MSQMPRTYSLSQVGLSQVWQASERERESERESERERERRLLECARQCV